jgi:hypothetical protein
VGFIIQSATTTDLPSEVVAAYDAPFPVQESKMGAAMFPLLVPLSANDPGAAEMLRTREAFSRWDKPALVYFSDSDPVFPPGAAKAMARLIPTAGEPEILPGAAPFLQEDKGEEIAERIAQFVADGWRASAAALGLGAFGGVDGHDPERHVGQALLTVVHLEEIRPELRYGESIETKGNNVGGRTRFVDRVRFELRFHLLAKADLLTVRVDDLVDDRERPADLV